MCKKKIVVFSGAGLDRESGILTFRDCKDGMWNNYKIDEVATPQAWRKDRSKVLEFYNQRRRELPNVEPNDAHKALVALEAEYDVTHVTQNVSDLLERGGSSNIIHLHGELTKARGSMYHHKPSPFDEVYDIGYDDINIGDKCKVSGSQLRPHIVWFGEYPFRVDEAYSAFLSADIVIIVGTSLQIGYTLSFFDNLAKGFNVIYIDPNPSRDLDTLDLNIEYVEKGAVEGVTEIVEKIINEQK